MPSRSARSMAARSTRSRLRGSRRSAVASARLANAPPLDSLTLYVILQRMTREGKSIRSMSPDRQGSEMTTTTGVREMADQAADRGGTMKALVQEGRGSADVLHLREVPRPQATEG